MIQPPSPLPPFSLPDQGGVLRTNADYLGRWLVIFAYPEDDTPNCTREARASSPSPSASSPPRGTATTAGFDQSQLSIQPWHLKTPSTWLPSPSFVTLPTMAIAGIQEAQHAALRPGGCVQ